MTLFIFANAHANIGAGHRSGARLHTRNLYTSCNRVKGKKVFADWPLRNDGLPRANMPNPIDPGVAVYFTYKRQEMAFACDKHRTVIDNVYAIAKTIEALRSIERWGASDMMERAFRGHMA